MNKNFAIKLLIGATFIALGWLGIFHHEMWGDELNDWLTARDSQSLIELFQNTRYSGHPLIWDGLLFLLTRFTHNPLVMQVLSVLISSLAAFLILKYAPFPLVYRACILFSYFFLFEYTIISRGYNITWLLLIVFCILFTRDKRNYLLLMLILALLANVHLFSLLLSLPLFIIIIYNGIKNQDIPRRQLVIGSILFLVAIAVSVICIIPPGNSAVIRNSTEGFFSFDRLSKTVSFLVKGLYPLPDFYSPYFWNSNFIVVHFKILATVFTVLLFSLPFIFYYDRPVPLFFFYSSVLLIMVALYVLKLFTGVHYMGYAFMIFMVTLWLSIDERLKASRKILLFDRIRTYRYKPFIWSILLMQVCGCAYAFASDYKRPFSEGKEVAVYLNTIQHKKIVICYPFYSGSAIAGYLEDKVYYPEYNSFCTFWNETPQVQMTAKEAFKKIKQVVDSNRVERTAIVLSLECDDFKALEDSVQSNFNKGKYYIKEARDFNNAIVKGENYKVYLINNSPQ